MMSYERLDVYQCSIDYLGLAIQIMNSFPRGHSQIIDQLKRASISIPLNKGEGTGKRTKVDCQRFYDIARGSAMECGAILDVCRKFDIASNGLLDEAKAVLRRIVAMLTKMGQRNSA